MSCPRFGQGQPTSPRCLSLLSCRPRRAGCQRHTPPPPFPSVTFSPAVLLPSCASAHLAPSWARRALQVIVVRMRVASAVASSDRKFGRRTHLETEFDRQHVLPICPSLSQQRTCILISVTNVRGPSASVRRRDHTVTEISQSNAPERSSHHTNLQLRTGLTYCQRFSNPIILWRRAIQCILVITSTDTRDLCETKPKLA